MTLNPLLKALRQNVPLVVLYLILCVVVVLKGPLYSPDSYAHFDMLINRSVLYAIFLNIPNWLFGIKMGYPILIVQWVIYLISVTFFIREVGAYFNLKKMSQVTLHFVFAYLAIFTYPVINFILSESIAYALLLVIIAVSLKYYKTPKVKYAGQLFLLFLLLLLTRVQFVVVLPFICGVFLLRYKDVLKSYLSILFIVGILATPLLAKHIEHVYYKIVLNEHIDYSMTYVHLITAPFYVSEAANVDLFKTQEEKKFFKRTKQWLDEKNLNINYAYDNTIDEFNYYQENFSKICNASIHEANMEYYKGQGFSFFDQHRKVSALTQSMFYPLLSKNLKNWLVITFKGFKSGLHGSIGLLTMALLMLGCVVLYYNQNKEIAWFVFGLITLKLLLHVVIAISVHSIHRYLFYFDWLLPLCLILLMDGFLVNNTRAKKL